MPPAGIRDKGDSPAPKRQAGKFLTVNLAAVFDPYHNNYQPVVVKLANQPHITHPEAAKPRKTAKQRLGETPRIGMGLQSIVDEF